MENKNENKGRGAGLGPVIIISAVLIGIVVVLKIIMG